MTLKVHIVLHHYQYYFETTGETFKETNGEFTETAHSTLRKEVQDENTIIIIKIINTLTIVKIIVINTLTIII